MIPVGVSPPPSDGETPTLGSRQTWTTSTTGRASCGMGYTLALKQLDPFGRRELGRFFACGDAITWEDAVLILVALRGDQPVRFHRDCFEHVRAGLNMFATLVLDGSTPTWRTR